MRFLPISGSGGGNPFNPAPSAGGGGKFTAQGVDANNTLRSAALARIVELVCEGPIVGLVNGGTSIYFNQTPVVNADGTVNFRGVQWESRTGLPDQVALPGNATASTEVAVGVQVQQSVPPPVVTIVDVSATSAQVIVSIPALYVQDDNGNIDPTSIQWNVQVQPAGGVYTVVDEVSLNSQKCVSTYQHQSTFKLPAGGSPWNIKIVRLTPDSDTTNLQNATYWDSYTSITAGNFIYPNSAVIGLTIDSALFQQGAIPTRSFHIQGLIIQVPSNYNPTTRVYTGVWDGTFKSAYSNNPAWVLYDILTNSRYGIGDFIDATKVDKWGLFTIAQYCDQSVPNGYGGTEPRYVFNGVLNSRQEAWKAIQSITSCFRGMTYWSTGQVFASSDMPADPVKLVTPANVIGGHFNYNGTGLKTRHSVATVRWNDPNAFYAPTVEVVVNDPQLVQFGWRETNLTAVGCTSRGQANRMGRWILDTEQFATETVEYTCSWDHVDIRPGDVIAIADPNKNQVRLGGRITVTGTTAITMDQPFTPLGGETYTFMAEFPDGTLGSSAVTSFSTDGTIAHLTTALAQTPLVGAMWVLTGSEVEPRQYRITNIAESDKHLFKITALFYDPSKYERVELGVSLPVIPYSQPKTTIDPPANLKINETVFFANGVAGNRLTLSWTPSDDFLASGYLIAGQSPNGGGVVSFGQTNSSSYDIDNPALGAWTFYVQSIGIDGRQSTYVPIPFFVEGWSSQLPPYVSHLEIFGQAGDDDFVGQDCHVTWVNNFPGSTTDVGQELAVGASNASPFYRDNVVTIVDTLTQTTLRQELVTSDDYIYTYLKNVNDNLAYGRGPQRQFTVEVAVQDTLGRQSQDDVIIVDNPAPPVMIPTVATANGQIFINWVNPSDPDFVGAMIWVSTDPNFNPLALAPVYQGPNNFFVYPGIIGDTYYIRMAGYDSFGANELNISPPIQIVCVGFAPNTTPPAVPGHLALTAGTTTMPTGEVIQTLTATWDASPSSNFAYFEIAIEQSGGSFISNQTSFNNYTFSSGLIAVQTYIVKVRAWSNAGFPSSFCSNVSLTMPAKTTPPQPPSGLTITTSLKSVYLNWVLSADPDIAHVEIWQGTTNVLSAATKVGSSKGTGFTITGLTSTSTYYFWVREENTSGLFSGYFGPVNGTLPAAVNIDIAAFAIGTTNIIAGAITSAQVAPATIVAGNIALATITGANLAAATIQTNNIASGAITAGTIAANAITSGKIAANTITGNLIQAGTITGSNIAAQTIAANNIVAATITGNLIAANTIQGTNIQAGSIAADRIQAGTITGTQMNISTSLPATITIGASGIALGNPAALVNAGSTMIGAGLIQLNGATALSSWQSGTDATKINGGTIQANTVLANSLVIGNRGIQIQNITFSFNPSNNVIRWSVGKVFYTNDSGSFTRLSTTAGTVTYIGQQVWVYWPKDSTTLTATTTDPSALANIIIFATYSAGSGLVVTYGNTIVDGSNIVTGTIQSATIAAGAVTANNIQAGTITTNEIAAGTITGANIAANTITGSNIVAGSITATQINIGTLPSSTPGAGSITTAMMAAGAAIGNIGAGAIDNTYLASGAALTNIGALGITSAYLAAAQVTADKLATGAALANIPAGAITGTYIANGTITTAQIAANAITADQIAAGSISAATLGVTALSAITANLGAVDAGTITSNNGLMLIDLNNNAIIISDLS